MKRGRGRCALLIAAGLVASALAVPSESEDAEQELAALSLELNALDDWMTEAERERNEKQLELRRLDKRVEDLERNRSESKTRLLEQSEAIAGLASEQTLLGERLVRESEALSKLAGVLSRLSGRRYAMLLFEQTSALQIDRVIRYTETLRDLYFERIEDYARSAADLSEIRTRLEEGIERGNSLQQGLADQHRALLSQREARSTYLASLETQLVSRGQERQELMQSAARIKRLLEELRARIDYGTGADFAGQRGRLLWPTEGRLRHAFGTPRLDTNVAWQGIFIATEAGARIRAVHAGTTIYRDWLKGFGNLMVVSHGDHHMSVYAQADSFFKSVGDPVEGGEVIGVTGSSGGAREQGVYFEIRVDGTPENPQAWLGRPSSAR